MQSSHLAIRDHRISPSLRELRLWPDIQKEGILIVGHWGKLIDATQPCLLIENVSYKAAHDSQHSFRSIRVGRGSWSFGLDQKLLRIAITPRNDIRLIALRRRFSTAAEALKAMMAEAARLGMSMDEFLRPENVGNRVLRNCLQYYADYPEKFDGLPKPFDPRMTGD